MIEYGKDRDELIESVLARFVGEMDGRNWSTSNADIQAAYNATTEAFKVYVR